MTKGGTSSIPCNSPLRNIAREKTRPPCTGELVFFFFRLLLALQSAASTAILLGAGNPAPGRKLCFLKAAFSVSRFHAKHGSSGHKRKAFPFWQNESVAPCDTDAVTLAVGDDENRAVRGKVVGILQKINSRLQDRPAPALYPDPFRYIVGGEIPGIVGGGIAENDAGKRDITRLAVAGDCSQRFAQQLGVHRA